MKPAQSSMPDLFIRLLMRPIASFCLRHALKIQELVEAGKIALISTAVTEIQRLGHTPTVSRISVMTGIHRGDVARLFKGGGADKAPRNVIARLIGQWLNSPRMTTAAGLPRVLTFDGKVGEFAELVQTVSRDLNPYTVLAELERLGAVERTPRGIRLVMREYIVKGNVEEALQHLSQDSDDLLSGVEENLLASTNLPNLHLRTEYDNISPAKLSQVRRWLLIEGSAFHERLNRFLAGIDRDVAEGGEKADGESLRVAVCSFSRTEVLEPVNFEEEMDHYDDD